MEIQLIIEGFYESTRKKPTLRHANLRNANLLCVILYGADLRGADLSDAKQDFIDTISKLPDEIPNLRNALMEGEINGSTYKGKCACLAGTIANHMGKIAINGTELANGFVVDFHSPCERLFRAIRKGDTPENNPISKIIVEWIDEAFPWL